jgi:hypothetical protein
MKKHLFSSDKYTWIKSKNVKKFVSNKNNVNNANNSKLIDLENELTLGESKYYENFDINKYGYTLQPGSIPADGIYEDWIMKLKPNVVIEVGSFLGYSAIKMAKEIKRLNLKSKIICVDTWLGSSEHYDSKDNRLSYNFGYPSIYYNFISNVIHENVQDIIIPFPFPSSIAYKNLRKVFDKLDIKAELIFIDGSHEEDDVYLDLSYYYQLLSNGGELWGDDWNWFGVQNAVAKFSNSINKSVTILDNNIHWNIKK